MRPETEVTCDCGRVALQLEGQPIISTECHCTSCREAGEYLQSLSATAAPLLNDQGATQLVLYRKDRVRCERGADALREYRLSADAKTRRVVATCCNSAMFLDFTPGHWLSLYGQRWPLATLPPVEMRTMTRDRCEGVALPGDVPNAETHSFRFFVKLIGAWAAMGFRTPEITFVNGALDA
ncbi:GFA family protein [Microbulbifer taiwanensis]|uniref:GFA family protein n=1 Tax=Microbulbifer taiwanensis TaxID=986746 RepID=A0ABW1YMG8_9GAMM|nr:hypothetical protein [Microbulbifer taiwanensis]